MEITSIQDSSINANPENKSPRKNRKNANSQKLISVKMKKG